LPPEINFKITSLLFSSPGLLDSEAPPQWGNDDLSPADDEIIERLHKNYVTANARSSDCSARDQLMEEIYELVSEILILIQ
jgi:hypothetical protein